MNPTNFLVVPVLLLAVTACAGSSAVGGSSADRASALPAAAAPTPLLVKTPANIRACRDAANVKIGDEAMLKQAVSGGGYLMGSLQTARLRITIADAVSGDAAPPTGGIGDEAGKAFDVIQSIRVSGGQGFIEAADAQQVINNVQKILALCNAAGVTAAEVTAVPPLNY